MPANTRILIVEDDTLIAFATLDMLETMGFDGVGPVRRVADAIELLHTNGGPDAALLDVCLGPQETSIPIADELKDRGIPFLFATAYSNDNLPERHRDAPCLSKPYSAGELRRTLSRLLEQE